MKDTGFFVDSVMQWWGKEPQTLEDIVAKVEAYYKLGAADGGALARPKPEWLKEDCRQCQDMWLEMLQTGHDDVFAPRHDGMAHCKSGSIASGGKHAHCTCDTCF